MSRALRVGLSTCPNDTFLFHALLVGAVESEVPLEFVLADVEQLNQGMLRGEFALAKTSVHAMLAMAERVVVLPVGMALGFGVGPLLLAAPARAVTPPLAPRARVLTPGQHTTAALLVRLFERELFEVPPVLEPTLFAHILPRLAARAADYGACIHEARFTWREHDVRFVTDLGERYESHTGAPLPLVGLCLDRRLDRATAEALARSLRRSLEWGHAHRSECLPTMRRHAQEQSDEVLWAHVDLYVNEWTLDLGSC